MAKKRGTARRQKLQKDRLEKFDKAEKEREKKRIKNKEKYKNKPKNNPKKSKKKIAKNSEDQPVKMQIARVPPHLSRTFQDIPPKPLPITYKEAAKKNTTRY